MNLIKKNLIYIQIDVVFIIIFLLSLLFHNYLGENFLKYEIAFFMFYTLVAMRIKLFDFCHPYIVFLITLFVFLYSRIILDIVGLSEFGRTTYFSNYEFATDIKITMLLILLGTIIFLNFGFNFANLFYNKDWVTNLIANKELQKISVYSMYLCSVFCLIGFWQVFIQVKEYGYFYLYSEHFEKPDLLKFKPIFITSYYMFLASIPEVKIFKKYTCLYMLILSGGMLSGARGEFATGILAVIVFYSTFIKKFKIRYIIIAGLVLIILLQIVGSIRTDQIDLLDTSLIMTFFHAQGVTLNALGYTIQFDEELNSLGLNKLLYPFTALWDRFIGLQRDLDYEKDNYFPHAISYLANPNFYYTGAGIGSSFVAELYAAVGFIGVLLGCFTLGFLIHLLNIKLRNNRIGIVILLCFWTYLFWMPRASFLGIFPILISHGRNIIIIMIILGIYKNIIKRKRLL